MTEHSDNRLHYYAEIPRSAVSKECTKRAYMVMAWCCRELGISATLDSIRWFVPKASSTDPAVDSWAWTHFERVSVFSHGADVRGLCGSPSEIWCRWGLMDEQQDETICHELIHMAAKQQTWLGDFEEIAAAGGVSLAASIDWDRAEEDYIDWLVDPDRWAEVDTPAPQASGQGSSPGKRSEASASAQTARAGTVLSAKQAGAQERAQKLREVLDRQRSINAKGEGQGSSPEKRAEASASAQSARAGAVSAPAQTAARPGSAQRIREVLDQLRSRSAKGGGRR